MNASTFNLADFLHTCEVFFACVLNQSHGHWLLNDVLCSIISVNLKLKEENKVIPSFESFMDGDLIFIGELSLLVITLKQG